MRSIVICLCWLVGLTPAAVGQQRPDPELMTLIDSIRAIDNHSHGLPVPDEAAVEAEPADPVGRSWGFQEVRLRESNPEWVESWRALYGYEHRDADPEHVRQLYRMKRARMREKGADYPAWILDKVGVEIALVNANRLGRGQTPPRFRWVPHADGLLLPFEIKDPTGTAQRRRQDIGLATPPTAFSEYLEQVVRGQLRRWRSGGAVAIKFTIAYFRPLEFARVPEEEAKAVYERRAQGGELPAKDFKSLQDFLFRFTVREAGDLGLVVQIHTGEGGGPFFGTAGSNPLLLESVLNDFALQKTVFVLVHGGFPFDRQVTSLIKKSNVYADFSGQTFFRSRRGLSETLRLWLELFPEKVLFGTDAFASSPLRGWEELAWISNRTGREALALALTGMMADGDITRPRAEEIARWVLRENAARVYGIDGGRPAT
jgi:uncharacterized protein